MAQNAAVSPAPMAGGKLDEFLALLHELGIDERIGRQLRGRVREMFALQPQTGGSPGS